MIKIVFSILSLYVFSTFTFADENLENEAVKLLQEINWTGNIRELRNIVERLIILGAKEITAHDVKTYTTVL